MLVNVQTITSSSAAENTHRGLLDKSRVQKSQLFQSWGELNIKKVYRFQQERFRPGHFPSSVESEVSTYYMFQ